MNLNDVFKNAVQIKGKSKFKHSSAENALKHTLQ